jgi:glucosamine--fructose-6-phosphate aminotransferase (isomerizing)
MAPGGPTNPDRCNPGAFSDSQKNEELGKKHQSGGMTMKAWITRGMFYLKANWGREIRRLKHWLRTPVYLGRCLSRVPPGALVLFPLHATQFGCGIAGFVALKRPISSASSQTTSSLAGIAALAETAVNRGFDTCVLPAGALGSDYLGGDEKLEDLWRAVLELKRRESFGGLYADSALQAQVQALAARLAERVEIEGRAFNEHMGRLSTADADRMSQQLDRLRDITWCLRAEILGNISKVRELVADSVEPVSNQALMVFRDLNAVLNSIDRMEVRGRDSAGVSLLFVLALAEYDRLLTRLEQAALHAEWTHRSRIEPLLNRSISLHRKAESVAVAFTYKVAVEIGRLGDNIRFLRHQIASDPILKSVTALPVEFHTVNAHTRWASVGAITEANCHPVDNRVIDSAEENTDILHTCLNGDIDNFHELKEAFESGGRRIPAEVTTDTKIIPLQIEHYLRRGLGIEESFRLALNDFKGSHAIVLHTSLAPGRLFLAQRGSGQAVFIGIAQGRYMPTSEVYGFIEETQEYIKLDGESVIAGKNGPTQGQIAILDQRGDGGLNGLRLMYYDGTPIALSPKHLKRTALTSRDIDRQDYPHYFLKEISEAPLSVEKTLQNRWKIQGNDGRRMAVTLDERVIPPAIDSALGNGAIRRIFFIGQGTAGVAALACANILGSYLNDPTTTVQALKASEFSGFALSEEPDGRSMADALVVAISQSGTTTDTNRSVDMARQRGAHAIAIVNRRDSDLTFKVHGVMYTSSGRDIEMSVASTKAFYAQIVAGALLGLRIACLSGRRDEAFVSDEIERLRALPGHMRRVLGMAERIQASARRLAVTKTYWAAVGSGPNKASADEIRIKLSELCYKTISSDYVEDKKHIDLSSEPLIIVCAAGTRPTVIGDIVKDTAIFKAHKAAPVVICDEGEDRFDLFAEDVFQVPSVKEHLAPILNTLVGHLWGYFAALSIHEGSRFLYRFQKELQQTVGEAMHRSVDVYELVLEKSFREKMAAFYSEFRQKRTRRQFPVTVGYDATTDLTLLLKYLAGRLPVTDFELDFGIKGTAVNMMDVLLNRLGEAVGFLSRPVDAIKHQAKTVTVGTSRISEQLEGLVFAALSAQNFSISHLTPANLVVLKNVQGVIRTIEGSILYRICGLNLLGEPDENTTIEVLSKSGQTAVLPSRVETDKVLKGTKRIIVRQGNVYIGKGRKDDRSILVIPLLSSEPSNAGFIEHLLLLHICFKENVTLNQKIRTLGGKYEHIKNIVQENSIGWEDTHLELAPIDELFGRSAEKIAELIVGQVKKSGDSGHTVL